MGRVFSERLEDPWNASFRFFTLGSGDFNANQYNAIYLSKKRMQQDFLPANTVLHPEGESGWYSSSWRENYLPINPMSSEIIENAYRIDVGEEMLRYLQWQLTIPTLATRFHHLDTYRDEFVDEFGNPYLGPSTKRYGIPDYYPEEWMNNEYGQKFLSGEGAYINAPLAEGLDEGYGYAGPAWVQGAWGLAPIYQYDGYGTGEYKWTFFKEANSDDWIDMKGDSDRTVKEEWQAPEASTWFPRKYSTENYDKGFLYYCPQAVQIEVAGFRKIPEGCTSSIDFDGADIVVENFERYRAINAKGMTGVSLAFIALEYNEHPSREAGYTGPIHENGFIPDGKAVELGLYEEFHANGVGGNEVNITGNDGNQYGVLVGTQKIKILTSQGTANQYGQYAYQVKNIKENDEGESSYRHLEAGEDAYEEEWQDVVHDGSNFWSDTLDLYCKGDVENNTLVTVDMRSIKPQKYGYTGLQSLAHIPIKMQSLHPQTNNHSDYFKDPDNIHEYADGGVCNSCDSYTIHLERDGEKVELNRIAEEASSGWYDFIRVNHDSRGNLPSEFEEINRLNAGVLHHVGEGVYESLGGSESQYFQRITFTQETSTTSVYLSLDGTEYNYSFSSGPGSFRHTSRRFVYEDTEEDYNHYITSGELPKDLSGDTPVQISVSEPENDLNFGDSVIYTGNFYDSSSDSENITIDYTIDPAVVADNTVQNVMISQTPLIAGADPCEKLDGYGEGDDYTLEYTSLFPPSMTVNGTFSDYFNLINRGDIKYKSNPYSTCTDEKMDKMRQRQLDVFFNYAGVGATAPNLSFLGDACCFMHLKGTAVTDVFSPVGGEMKFQWGTDEGHGASSSGPHVFGAEGLLGLYGQSRRGTKNFFSTKSPPVPSGHALNRKFDLFKLVYDSEGIKLIIKAMGDADDMETGWPETEIDLLNFDKITGSYSGNPKGVWDMSASEYGLFQRGDGTTSFYDGTSSSIVIEEDDEEDYMTIECGQEGSRFPGIVLKYEDNDNIYCVSIAFQGENVVQTTNLDLFGEDFKLSTPRIRPGTGLYHAGPKWVEPVYIPKNQ